MSDIALKITVLEAENDLLRERVAFLERSIGSDRAVPRVLGLTATESRVLAVLVVRVEASKDQILTIAYNNVHGDELPDPKIIDVFICKIRAKLRPFDIGIDTIWGQGYRLRPEMKKRIQDLLATESQAEAA